MSSFTPTTEELSALHDPKSLASLAHLGGVDALASALHTDLQQGIPAGANIERVERYGINKLPAKKPKSFFALAWEAMHDKVLILLSVAAVVSLALGLYETFGQDPDYDYEGNPIPQVEWVEGVAIIVAVAIVVVVGAANDYQKERQFAKLNSKKEDRDVVVIRAGSQTLVSVYDLVVGDLIVLQTGDVVPSDAVLISGACECDESAMTGESNTIKKVPAAQAESLFASDYAASGVDIGTKGVPDPYLISGSKLLSGLGNAVVTAVGPNSVHGRTMASLQVEAEVTPLQARLDNLANGIAKFGFIAALILFIVLFIKFLVNITHGSDRFLEPSKKGSKFLNILITAITIIVVAVPEGLPLAVTLALAFATTRMAKDGNLVRVLRSCEIMGGATAVCSDKTGTLTENRMRVVKGLLGESEFSDSHSTEHDAQEPLVTSLALAPLLDPALTQNILKNIIVNSTAFENTKSDVTVTTPKGKWYQKTQPPPLSTDSESYLGNKTETALLLLAENTFGAFKTQPLAARRDAARADVVQTIPFESLRKWGGIVCRTATGHRFFVKGASEIVLAHAGFRCSAGGEISALDAPLTAFYARKVEQFATAALRTLALAHRDFPGVWPPRELINPAFSTTDADPELLFGAAQLVVDTVVGIQDPLRAGVPLAVEQCQKAGVTVRMVTGDNLITAKSISLGCGILTPEDARLPESCMEGPAFRKLSAARRLEIVPHLRVLARSSPEDKKILVQTLKNMGEVVAVTGDGTNDAPALKLADVGFSMGIAGTEVAREASDIILMTDDFSAIVKAIVWGRTVATSIKKFIQFQLTVNVTAVVLTFVSAVADKEGTSVLTAVQLLWVNLIMDTLAALALATDRPDDNMLKRKPAGRTAPLISVSMWKMILLQSSMQLIITFVLHFAGVRIFFGADANPHEQAQIASLTFNAFVWLQFFNIFVARKLDEGDDLTTFRERFSAYNLNFFDRLFSNWYFVAIALIIGGGQVLIMYVGGAAFSVSRQTGAMWGTALICGLLSLPFGVLIRLIPNLWALAVFPRRLYNAVMYAGSFKWMRSASKDPEANFEEEYASPLLAIPAFRRARHDILKIKRQHQSGRRNFYKDWKGSSSEASSEVGSDDDHTEKVEIVGISALAMVPTVVGGAVAGWSGVGRPEARTDL
ncbi:hypothetical protein BABINDRAFT_162208 [Babjeviella inositovora NRRL Y-12698]|uniref:Calcium-transporting ATPase n=1 Tax=Babjeviella inositovora NRRL Y-12698 TaxID=984486 RepID=A0A1E3QN96_9ASCO|nr:uncharacterized protein BABINDRAFT_162208 [Babjeviella inositovora NRRL Y-12698]ODQ79153.1 hypothetical protein BABINDRAFT_162208 [Babjeviella inositovora NRRL Y-12698]